MTSMPKPSVAAPAASAFSPREIVSELDRFIVGQHDAKRAVAIALRNRWRRQQLDEAMRERMRAQGEKWRAAREAADAGDDTQMKALQEEMRANGAPRNLLPGSPPPVHLPHKVSRVI